MGLGLFSAAACRAVLARILEALAGIDSITCGLSLHQMAAGLSARGIRTPQAGTWKTTAVRRVLARAAV
jgi:hypothetical protein